ncbi:hypothetical protein AVEN_165333-1 [Araneus ventricosus]|uniref:Uncharacterized protein n=1 Tax=Araneus ventricosus TaxID=182803 RepID=A0A4Y1ZNC0_ARAVE|nr:hypothetical protein AVEN_77776-1 [Araneus ventricosus]GBL83114.1 hypothetical protein AVEN_165333-1 [Araneus ventricosus]
MSPRTGSIRKYQNSQSLMGALPSLDSKPNLTLTSVGEVQLSTPSDKRNPTVYVLIRVSSLARWHSFLPPAKGSAFMSPSLALFLQR